MINKMIKIVLFPTLLLFAVNANAWSVSNKVIELPGEAKVSERPIVEPEFHSEPEKTLLIGQARELESSKTAGTFEKRLSKPTAKENIDLNYWRAVDLINNGDYSQAEHILIRNLSEAPRHQLSRIELVTFYLKRDQLVEAESYLQSGLRLEENHPEFLRLMAVIHDRRDEPEKALSLLVKVKGPRIHDKNYIAFLGHIYQQMGSYALARKQYFRLMQFEPNNPLWLLGATIALDSEGKKAAALEGYRRLAKEGHMESQMLEYVRGRIVELKG